MDDRSVGQQQQQRQGYSPRAFKPLTFHDAAARFRDGAVKCFVVVLVETNHWIRHNIEETARSADVLPALYEHARSAG